MQTAIPINYEKLARDFMKTRDPNIIPMFQSVATKYIVQNQKKDPMCKYFIDLRIEVWEPKYPELSDALRTAVCIAQLSSRYGKITTNNNKRV